MRKPRVTNNSRPTFFDSLPFSLDRVQVRGALLMLLLERRPLHCRLFSIFLVIPLESVGVLFSSSYLLTSSWWFDVVSLTLLRPFASIHETEVKIQQLGKIWISQQLSLGLSPFVLKQEFTPGLWKWPIRTSVLGGYGSDQCHLVT